ncbi:MAG: transposase [Bacilli bacterium]|nr:transposase [Bacilli bacterium]
MKSWTFLCPTFPVHYKYWYIYMTASKEEACKVKGDVVMGVDLGVRVPAVCVTSTKKIKFVGNGRYIRYIERTMKAKYRKLDKVKNKTKIKKMNHKLAHIKHHLDHQMSKEIVEFAVENKVAFINLEKLTGLQQAMVKRKMRKEYIWSYYQMQQYLEHKASLKGIQIRYIDPYNTSKQCPLCDRLNNPKGRLYSCACGYRAHRDLVGAFNIMRSTRIYTDRP